MSVVAVYNMKGGVGKTTTAVNLSYLAAASGQRALLWDLDPQAASSFAFRVRPHVEGFRKKSLKGAETFVEAIKETDYDNLHLLPADFAYRKLDRLLGRLGKPERVVMSLVETLGRDYDVVLLDCPAGFSLLTEGVFAAADAVLVPTIPTVFSLRTLARAVKWADRSDSPPELAAFFSMVDRRKALHRRACEWSAGHLEVFLAGHIPYASVVEQMAVRRMPLGVFAPRDSATIAFAGIWAELQTRLQQRRDGNLRAREGWKALQRAIESLIAQLESADAPEPSHGDSELLPGSSVEESSGEAGGLRFIHGFDTERRGLQRSGYVLELHEHAGNFLVVAARNAGPDTSGEAQVQIDKWWATQILSGVMSPISVLERRLGPPVPSLVEHVRGIVGERRLLRIDSRLAEHTGNGHRRSDATPGPVTIDPAG